VLRSRPGSDFHFLGGLGQPIDNLGIDCLVNKKPAAGGADLTLVGENAGHCSAYRGWQVGIGEDDVGRLPTQFQRHTFQIARAG